MKMQTGTEQDLLPTMAIDFSRAQNNVKSERLAEKASVIAGLHGTLDIFESNLGGPDSLTYVPKPVTQSDILELITLATAAVRAINTPNPKDALEKAAQSLTLLRAIERCREGCSSFVNGTYAVTKDQISYQSSFAFLKRMRQASNPDEAYFLAEAFIRNPKSSEFNTPALDNEALKTLLVRIPPLYTDPAAGFRMIQGSASIAADLNEQSDLVNRLMALSNSRQQSTLVVSFLQLSGIAILAKHQPFIGILLHDPVLGA